MDAVITWCPVVIYAMLLVWLARSGKRGQTEIYDLKTTIAAKDQIIIDLIDERDFLQEYVNSLVTLSEQSAEIASQADVDLAVARTKEWLRNSRQE